MPLLTQISFLVGLLNFILFTIQIQITDCLDISLIGLDQYAGHEFLCWLITTFDA